MVDRVIPQALRQGRQPAWDKPCSEGNYGFRPARAAPHAVVRAPRSLHAGYSGVVDRDLETCCDRVNHEKLLSRVKERVADRRVLQLCDRSLKAGALTDAGLAATAEGTPPGGPVSPLLANLRLDGRDKEVERRGHRFGRSADDGTIDVKSARAGQRVLARGTRFLTRHLTLTVNAAKRAVDRPWQRPFLEVTFAGRRPNRRRVSDQALKAYQQGIRRRTSRTRGVSVRHVGHDVPPYVTGWDAYLGCVEVPSRFKALDSWLRRRRRC